MSMVKEPVVGWYSAYSMYEHRRVPLERTELVVRGASELGPWRFRGFVYHWDEICRLCRDIRPLSLGVPEPEMPSFTPERAALERVLNSANYGLTVAGVRRSKGDTDGMEDAKLLRALVERVEKGVEVYAFQENVVNIDPIVRGGAKGKQWAAVDSRSHIPNAILLLPETRGVSSGDSGGDPDATPGNPDPGG